MSTQQQPYSVHSFMLPFRWDYLSEKHTINEPKEKSSSFEERTNLKYFLKYLIDGNSKWHRKFFKIDGKASNFNEFHYFHAYAARTMFDLQQPDETDAAVINESKVMVYFELAVDPDTDTYTIKTLQKKYTLILSGISLHVYNTGVAILTINVENNLYQNKESILEINEYGRRLYPQFLDAQFPHIQKVKQTFLADSITISIAGMGDFEDGFGEYNDIAEREVHHYNGTEFKRSWVVRIPFYIRQLFGDKFFFVQKEEKPGSIRLNILTDDRMFFLCWYGSNELAEELKIKEDVEHITVNYFTGGEYTIKEKKTVYPYLTSNFWYAYIVGDKAWPAIANKKMQVELTEKYTYTRWAGYGTLFGFTKDSFVALSQDVPALLSNYAPDLRLQMKTLYYQMAVLSLAQRVSVLRFSGEVSSLADITKKAENKKLVENIKILYRNYIEFINKINYKEITPYIQGIEMYTYFRNVTQIQDNVKNLDEELNELFTYIKLQEDEKQGEEAHMLTKIATWFLPASFLALVL
jgi:hypothetical protein